MDSQALAGLGGLLVIFLMVLAVLWFFLPFAVFGIKDLLQRIIYAVEANTKATEALHETLKANNQTSGVTKD